MPTHSKRQPNELKPRRPFLGDTRHFVQRLNEQIEELEHMKKSGFTHTVDGQSIDGQISLRKQFVRKAAESHRIPKGRW